MQAYIQLSYTINYQVTPFPLLLQLHIVAIGESTNSYSTVPI